MLIQDDLTPDYQNVMSPAQRRAEEAIQRRKEAAARGESVGNDQDHKWVDIDRETVIKLARLHATRADIARWFGVDPDTIATRFQQDIDLAMAETRTRLKNKMLEKALNGDTTMLIWISKNWLGFGDNGPINSDANAPLPWKDQ
jgi:hypothetical protein